REGGGGGGGAQIVVRRAVLRGPEHDRAVVQLVVDRKHGHSVAPDEGEPANAAGRDQPQAFRLIQRLQGPPGAGRLLPGRAHLCVMVRAIRHCRSCSSAIMGGLAAWSATPIVSPPPLAA